MNHEFDVDSEMTGPGRLTVRVRGELDQQTASALEAELREWLGIAECVIDLSECAFVDSTDLGALVMCRSELGDAVPLRLVGVSPALEHTLRLAGLQNLFGLDHPAA